jgi:hypothetical protein
MNGEFRWMPQRSQYVLTIHTPRLDHHFEADPKMLHTDDLWMQLMREVADFLAARGTDVNIVKTKIKDYADIYLSTPYEQQEQNTEAGGTDDGRSLDTGGPDAAGEFVSAGPPGSGEPDSPSAPAPVAWDNFPQADRPSAPEADVGTSGPGGAA